MCVPDVNPGNSILFQSIAQMIKRVFQVFGRLDFNGCEKAFHINILGLPGCKVKTLREES